MFSKKGQYLQITLNSYFKPAKAGFGGGSHIYPNEHVIEENQVFWEPQADCTIKV